MKHCLVALVWFILGMMQTILADDYDEFKIKRENNFEFQTKPHVEKEGAGFNIVFETKSFCDVTVVIIEKGTEKIVRHLASGVLGPKAPAPLLKDTKKQKIYFDGKDDNEEYLRSLQSYHIRVSLGLSPKYGNTFMDSPYRRQSQDRQLLAPIKDGVLVYDGGNGLDFVRLYDHDGHYLRTIYPFPANKIQDVKGLTWHDRPDGQGKFPVKTNFLQTSFLEVGAVFSMEGRIPTNFGWGHYGQHTKSATFLAANDQMSVFGMGYMARLALDGSSGGLDFNGHAVGYLEEGQKETILIQPSSAAFSTDGKKIYFTGYHICHYGKATQDIITSGNWVSYPYVSEMDLASKEPPKVFIGDPLKAGNDDHHFDLPVSVCVDDQNRIYVCDYLNNRVQVFDQNKKLLKSVNVQYPAYVTVLPKSKEVVVVSHIIQNTKFSKTPPVQQAVLFYNLGKFENMAVGKSIEFPKEYVQLATRFYSGSGFSFGLAATDMSGELRLWISQEKAVENVMTRGKIASTNLKVWQIKDGKFSLVADFEKEAQDQLVSTEPVHHHRARLQVNPITGDLYATKTIHGFAGKSFKQLFKINPNTGKVSLVDLAFDAEDYTFDSMGYLYLKSQDTLGRYDILTGKEVPFDYGSETKASTSTSSDRKVGDLISGLRSPTTTIWHQGGIYVNLKGNIVIAGQYYPAEGENIFIKWAAQMYPGRPPLNRLNNLIHIYDKHGNIVKQDVVPGLKDVYGVGIDNANNVYLMDGSPRILNGKIYSNAWTGTVMKFPFKGARFISDEDTPIPLPKENRPKRPYDLKGKWGENVEWFFGGVGVMGKNSSKGVAGGTGCACWNARMALDYLNRSFVPELERCSISILDSSGNLITRIGKYGNRDSRGAKSLVPVGGDEITMMHGAYLATLTDKKLYYVDVSNDRIVGVDLEYATNEVFSFPAE